MKQPKYKIVDSFAVAPAQTQTISGELDQIRKLIDANKKLDAWNAAKALHGKHPDHPIANYGMALAIYNAGQKSAALPYAEAAVKKAPDNALYHLFLGKLYVDLEMLEFAPAVLEKAAALDKTMFQAPWIMAEYYFGLSQGEKALQYYQEALALVPKEAINRLKYEYANCIATLGRVDEAETVYSELFSDPIFRRGALMASALLRKHDQESEIAAQIRTEMVAPGLTDQGRSALLLTLGRLYENGAKYDEAFQSFQESRKLLASKYDIGPFRSEVNDKINTITPDIVSRFRGFGDPSNKPIFVVGMPRSGTTLTEQIIAAHSQAAGVGELKRVHLISRKLAGDKGMAGILSKISEMGPLRWKTVSQQYLNLLDALAPNTRHTVDKMPHNFRDIGFIHLCFPNAKIIHCRRNPLDNFISAFQNLMNANHSYAYDQTDYGEYYLEYRRLMNHWKSIFPESIYESDYEALTQNPEMEVRKILDFLGLPWEDACLKFNERKSTVKTFSLMQVRNPINKGSIARWRNYEKQLSPVIAILKRAGMQI
ncbi:MAG: sulfotransferase [Hyphomicrobiales bacterium]|nr:sulfotransferase [Hyphomicrobiales bacterium]